jgi:5-methylcytosine-specific restriction protein B
VSPSGVRARKAWIFQANTKKYKLLESLDLLERERWLVNRYADEISAGDIAFIWKAGQRSGIYAVGEIVSNPELTTDFPESMQYWVDRSEGEKNALRVEIRYLRKFSLLTSLKKGELGRNQQLANMSIFRQPQATNFRVTNSQFEAISKLLETKYGFKLTLKTQ